MTDQSDAVGSREGEAPAELNPGALRASRKLRHRPVHGILPIAGQPLIVFLTVCTKGRSKWLATSDVHLDLVDVWKDTTAWLVGRYVILPDHLHLFVSPGNPELPLENWVRYWKSQYSKRVQNPDQRWETDF